MKRKLYELGVNLLKKDDLSSEEIESPTEVKGQYVKLRHTKLNIQIGNYETFASMSGNRIIFTVWQQKQPVAYLEAWKNNKTLWIETAKVVKTHLGQRIIQSLYEQLILKMGMKLVAHGTHSPGAKKLWVRIWENPNLRVYALDKNKKYEVKPNESNTELEISHKTNSLYRDMESLEDVVDFDLVAVKKK